MGPKLGDFFGPKFGDFFGPKFGDFFGPKFGDFFGPKFGEFLLLGGRGGDPKSRLELGIGLGARLRVRGRGRLGVEEACIVPHALISITERADHRLRSGVDMYEFSRREVSGNRTWERLRSG